VQPGVWRVQRGVERGRGGEPRLLLAPAQLRLSRLPPPLPLAGGPGEPHRQHVVSQAQDLRLHAQRPGHSGPLIYILKVRWHSVLWIGIILSQQCSFHCYVFLVSVIGVIIFNILDSIVKFSGNKYRYPV
jgi:hypothetical protein